MEVLNQENTEAKYTKKLLRKRNFIEEFGSIEGYSSLATTRQTCNIANQVRTMEDREYTDEAGSDEEMVQDRNTVVITQSHPYGEERLEPKTHGLPPSPTSSPWRCDDGSAARGGNSNLICIHIVLYLICFFINRTS